MITAAHFARTETTAAHVAISHEKLVRFHALAAENEVAELQTSLGRLAFGASPSHIERLSIKLEAARARAATLNRQH